MQFSFIIPTYNYGHMLVRALDSIFHQPGDDYEVVIINDGSTDNTADVVQPYIANFAGRCRYIEQKNQGVSVARNRGIDESRGNYLILLDADDEMVPDVLPEIRKKLTDNEQVSMLLGGHYSIRNLCEEKLYNLKPLPESKKQCFLDFINKKIYANNGAAVIKREVFDKIRYQPGLGNSEDVVVFSHIFANYLCISIDIPLARMHRHSDSLRTDLSAIDQSGFKVVDYIFDENKIPDELMVYKEHYYYARSLSLFRKYYRAKHYQLAAQYYYMALKGKPLRALQLIYFGKYLRMLPKLIFGER
jgi:glycosyltransferase involved in cell wall biosynthesis